MATSDQNRGKMSREQAGSLGGKARAEKYDHSALSQQAKKGAETVERERPGFHSEIGSKGGKAGGAKGGRASHGGSRSSQEEE